MHGGVSCQGLAGPTVLDAARRRWGYARVRRRASSEEQATANGEALVSPSGALPGPRTTRWEPRGGAELVTSPAVPLARFHFRFEK